MARIKVTGYMDTEDMEPEHVDLGHESGLSSDGDDRYMEIFMPYLEGVEFELET